MAYRYSVEHGEGRRPTGRLVWIVLTFLAAYWSIGVQVQWMLARWNYPVLSLHDAPRSLFVVGEFQRHLSLANSGKVRLDPNDEAMLPDFEEFVAEAKDAAAHGRDVRALKPRLQEMVWVANLIQAGWADKRALDFVRSTDDVGAPTYARSRIDEVRRGDFGADWARTRMARRLSAPISACQWLPLLAALVVLAFVRRFAGQMPPLRGPVRIGLLRALAIFVWAQAAATAADYVFSPPQNSTLGLPIFGFVLALVSIALIKTTQPNGEPSVLRALALPEPAQQNWLLGATVLTTGVSCGLLVVVRWVTWRLNFVPNASEGLMEGVLYGSTLIAAASIAESIIWFPVSEELLFRGALFGGLAKHLSVHSAAMLSAAAFALTQGYGLVGTFTLLINGYLWARVYALTGSLLPGLFVHASNNALAVLWTLAMRATVD